METTNETLVVEKKYDGQIRSVTDAGRTWPATGRVAWDAIIAGVIVISVAQMLLSLLGVGVGLGTINPATEAYTRGEIGTGAIVWWSVSMLVSLFLGGWVAGKVYRSSSKRSLTWLGLLTWCAFTFVSALMLTWGVGKAVYGNGTMETVFGNRNTSQVTSGTGSGTNLTDNTANPEVQRDKVVSASVQDERAMKNTASASLIAFFALIVGAIVTMLGARAAWINENLHLKTEKEYRTNVRV